MCYYHRIIKIIPIYQTCLDGIVKYELGSSIVFVILSLLAWMKWYVMTGWRRWFESKLRGQNYMGSMKPFYYIQTLKMCTTIDYQILKSYVVLDYR